MKKSLYIAITILGISCFALGMMTERTLSPQYPSDMRFYMYCEPCQECGYDEKEVEFSIVSNLGFSICKQCDSHYTFTLDNKGNKTTEKNGDNQ